MAGDPAGLAGAYNRYANVLYGYAKTFLREPADAADVVHDTFVVAAGNRGRVLVLPGRRPVVVTATSRAVARPGHLQDGG